MDFTNLYQTSRLTEMKGNEFVFRVGKSKKSSVIKLEISSTEITTFLKDFSSLYAFEVSYKDTKSRSNNFLLKDYEIFHLLLKIPKKMELEEKMSINMLRVLDTKEISKGFFDITKGELEDPSAFCEKTVLNRVGKA